MKSNNLIILILIFINCSFSKNNIEVNLTNFTLSIKESVKELFFQIKNSTNNKSKCFNDISDYYNKSNNAEKFILDSSKTKNDLIPYLYCLENKSNEESIFIITKIYELELMETKYINSSNKTDNITIDTQSNNNKTENYTKYMLYPNNYILGLCLPKIESCDVFDYKSLINKIFELRYELFQVNTSYIEFETIHINKFESVYNNFELIKILNFIPFIFILIQIIFCIFPSIPRKIIINIRILICCCRKKPNLSFYKPIKNSFTISENLDEIYGNEKNNSKINNDAGLKYIIGIRGINIIFMIIGIVFQILINSPSHIHSAIHFNNMISNLTYGLIFYSVRYAPRILFASSGFILSYKLLCFFDDRAEELRDKRLSSKQKELIEKSNEKKKSVALPIKPQIKINNDITFNYVFIFCLYQIHKYLIFILSICFFRFTIYYFQFKGNLNPFWKLLYETILKKVNFFHLVSQILLIKAFAFKLEYYLKSSNGDSDLINQKNDLTNSTYLDYYWIFINEIIFFIIGVFFIFFIHKCRKVKIFYIINIGVIISIVAKMFFFIVYFSPLEYLSNYGYGKIFKNPLFNLSFYLIGIYFGLINYIIEKRYNADFVTEQKRIYLLLPALHANLLYTTKKNWLFKNIFCVYILVAICNEIHFIIFQFFYDQYNTVLKISYIGETILKIYLLFDTELVVISLILASFYQFIKTNNKIYTILSFKFWIKFHKLYYAYIITLPSVCLYFLYQSESRITINSSNTLFYSTIIFIITHIIAVFVFVIFEMPYKRLIKLLLKINIKEKEKEKEKENYDDDEEDNEEKIII